MFEHGDVGIRVEQNTICEWSIASFHCFNMCKMPVVFFITVLMICHFISLCFDTCKMLIAADISDSSHHCAVQLFANSCSWWFLLWRTCLVSRIFVWLVNRANICWPLCMCMYILGGAKNYVFLKTMVKIDKKCDWIMNKMPILHIQNESIFLCNEST
jgi:hypothetical protein